MSPHGDTRQITCHIGAPSRELRQANRHGWWRRIDWRSVASHVLVAVVGMAALILAMGVLR
ncbi:MAG: hypothetical protein IT564_11980 [Rhodospirillales bacterium]|nr:hypothetical protein [Rhodospirillales bacterium]